MQTLDIQGFNWCINWCRTGASTGVTGVSSAVTTPNEKPPLAELDDLVEGGWKELVGFDQREKEQFLVLLIDKVLF